MQTHAMAQHGISGGRLSRGLTFAWLAVRQGWGRVAGKLTRDEQKKLDRFTREAERYVAVLGDMKGVAMKVGQLLSFLDAGAIPEKHRAAYQQIVGALQADAPPMPFETVRVVLERELDRPIDEVFASISERPMAAASIGQVHAAELPDGRAVVVKVQYPGVGDAIRADLENTELIASFARLGAKLSPIRVTADPTAIAEEITERVSEELDYRIEAANQTEFRAHYEVHPFIRIPEVVADLSTERVLVMDHHDGHRWTAALEQPQELKDAWGEVVYRFVFGSLYDFGAFNADPHPGNYLFHDDGGVTFLDFGCVKRFSPEQVAIMRRISKGVFDGVAATTFQSFQDLGCIPRRSKLDPQRVFDWWAPIWDPGGGEPFTFTPEFAAATLERNFNAFGEWGDVVRGMGITPEAKDWAFLIRIQGGLYSVLGALQATRNWRAIHNELMQGSSCTDDATVPVEVGRLEPHDWLGRRIHVVIDRPLGSTHPAGGFEYEVNYGYVPGFIAPDGEELDVYVLGPVEPLDEFVGDVIAVVLRSDDVEDKLVVGERADWTADTIGKAIAFQEQFFDSRVVTATT